MARRAMLGKITDSANDEPDLFGVKRKTRKAKPPAPDGATGHLIHQYKQLYETRYGEQPHFTNRDGAIFKRLILEFGEAVVSERLAIYMRWNDKFAEEAGHSVGAFSGCWSRLTAQAKQRKTRSVPDVDATREYMRRVRDAKGE